MKRYIHHTMNIFAMASDRSYAKNELRSYSRTLTEHIVKCIVYRDTTNNLAHWVEDEICEYLSIANDITLKPKNKKFKVSDYVDTLFGQMGDSREDARRCLRAFRVKNLSSHKYPEFDITDDMVTQLFRAFKIILDKVPPILATNNKLDRQDFYNIVYDAITG